MRIIKLDEKNVIINQEGLFRWYDAIKRYIPKRIKKILSREKKICRIHQNKFDIYFI